ncbi:MAG: hypothetical protein A3I05_03565 [Deltaproteobacteria bacterium RIFCSPLOWO2_02_FULL_44_10]|nr:MAG: hypothetical protein A3C46_03140 [Deltaproteobacteria bacterium RIFCSPHIGHO2_02_FULL_44_16]OGQ46264.1 MAG: hypothetical protein A3I05_03565 [Deltaproteobacteria bacterium RIFCSPLOWO2_02_FULL_44_10]
MHVLLEENHTAPVISLNVLFKVGSAFETDSEAGIAHVIEHMLFKGTPTRAVGTIAHDVEACGGDINAYTSFDQTVYYINMASRFADQALEILADAVQHPLFDAEELAREQEVILEEIRREHDSPHQMVGEYLFRTAYSTHPYGRPIIGFPETVKSFTSKDLKSFYTRWYTPANTVLIVVGDFQTKQMLKKIERVFSGFQGPPPPHNFTINQEPPQTHLKIALKSMNIQSTHFALAFHIPHICHDDIPALDILSYILGGTESARLEQKIKEKRHLVHHISAHAYTPRDPGLFIIGGLMQDANVKKAFEAITQELKLIMDEPISMSEISRAKINIRANEFYERETVGGEAGKLAYFLATAGTSQFEERYYHMLTTVTPQDVQRVAQTYLAMQKATSILLTPQKSKWKGKGEELKNILQQKPKISSSKRSQKKDPTTLTHLSNGVTLIIHENHTLPLVSITAAAPGGLRFETKQNNGINALISQLVTKGTTSRTALNIAHDIEKIAGEINGFSGRHALGLRSEFLSEHLRDGISIFTDVLISPAFAADEVAKEKRLQLQAIRQQEDALAKLVFMDFLKTLFPTHPYGLKSLGSKSSVSKLASSPLLKFWKSRMRAQETVIAVVGDVSPQEIKDLLAEYIFKLSPGKGAAPHLHDDPAPRIIQKTEIKKREKKQAHMVLGFQGPRLKENDTYAMIVLNNILSGQGGRLFLKLRDQMSLAYSVTSLFQPGIDPGHFAVYIGTDPAKLTTAIDAILLELDSLLREPVKKIELHRSQQYLVGTHELEQQRNSTVSMNFALNHICKLGIDEARIFPQKILKVTVEDIQRVAKKYIKLDAYTLAIVRPA